MLTITVPGQDLFDDAKQEFIVNDPFVLQLEHSLVSLSKWEAKFEKPFLSPGKKTTQEVLDYIKAMILTENVPSDVLDRLSSENLDAINEYIESKQTATTFTDPPGKKGRSEIVTSELVYYWMVAHNIPFECQHWHLNRLLTLIRVCSVKNSKPKKMSRSDLVRQRNELNAQRKAQLNTTG